MGTALWGASSLSCASAFATPAFVSSVASNAFVSRRTSLASSALQQEPFSLYHAVAAAAAAAGASPATARRRRQQQRHSNSSGGIGGGGDGMVMLFDFIKKRAQEGVEQTQNLVTAAQTGRLDEALKETSAYVKDRRVYRCTELQQCCCCRCWTSAAPPAVWLDTMRTTEEWCHFQVAGCHRCCACLLCRRVVPLAGIDSAVLT